MATEASIANKRVTHRVAEQLSFFDTGPQGNIKKAEVVLPRLNEPFVYLHVYVICLHIRVTALYHPIGQRQGMLDFWSGCRVTVPVMLNYTSVCLCWKLVGHNNQPELV